VLLNRVPDRFVIFFLLLRMEICISFVNLIQLVSGVRQAGHYLVHSTFFDTLKVHLSSGVHDIYRRSGEKKINLRIYNEGRVNLFSSDF